MKIIKNNFFFAIYTKTLILFYNFVIMKYSRINYCDFIIRNPNNEKNFDKNYSHNYYYNLFSIELFELLKAFHEKLLILFLSLRV